MSGADTDTGTDAEQVDDSVGLGREALTTAVKTIEAANESGEGVVERATAEREAINDFAESVAVAVQHGLPRSAVSQYSAALVEATTFANKTDICSDVDEAIEGASHGDLDADPLDGYLTSHVERIDAVRSTDAKQSTLYVWYIDDPACGRYQIETGDDAATSHFEWRGLRAAIFDASGTWTTPPGDGVAGEWVEWVGPFINERAVEVISKGSRTVAVEALQNHVARSVAYPAVADMIDHHGVGIDDDPEDGEPSELWIRHSEVAAVCDDFAITERALQVELEARGWGVDRIPGVSESTYVHGEATTYWVLDAGFAGPGAYVAEPEGSEERVDRLMRNDAESDATDDDGGEPGLIGSTEGSGSNGGEIE